MGEQPNIFEDPVALARALPWVAALTADDRAAFAREAAACASSGDGAALAELLEDWRATAEYLSDPTVAASVARDPTGTADEV